MALMNECQDVVNTLHGFMNSSSGTFEQNSRRLINVIVTYLNEDIVWIDKHISKEDRKILKKLTSYL